MTTPTIAPYGSWRSAVTADLIVAETVGLGSPCLDGEATCWLESRPTEGGRSVLVRRATGEEPRDLVPSPFSVRSRVHEYGGAPYCVAGGEVWFVNDEDQRLYYLGADGVPVPLTGPRAWRLAEPVPDLRRGRLLCIREDHEGDGEPTNALVAVDTTTGEVQILVSGHDFAATPRLSPDGDRLAWLTWEHPDMPWDGTALWVARLDDDGRPTDARQVCGGRGESVFQPEWSPDGELVFVSDRSGWWNLYRWRNGDPLPVCPMPAEFGLPQWVFGMRTYGFADAGTLVTACCQAGSWQLCRVALSDGTLTPVASPFVSFDGLVAQGGRAVFVGGVEDAPESITELDLDTGAATSLRSSSNAALDTSVISRPEALSFPTTDGDTAHGFFYPPCNPAFQAPEGTLPPLIVRGHGGPTAATSRALNLGIQFWTSRGFALLDVNYRGSTGFGRAYRERLDGQWGLRDVDDCEHGALHLARTGRVHPGQLAIRGSSAGGYTTLAALTFRDTFTAGASYYGISDLEALARDTHKFESRYLDRLVGPWPETRERYRERSPVHFTDRLACPVIFFQGLEDRVVPPNQAQAMVDALRKRGLPVAYLPFEGERHGFRQAANIKAALEAELCFYGRIFGFEPADALPAISIHNLGRGTA